MQIYIYFCLLVLIKLLLLDPFSGVIVTNTVTLVNIILCMCLNKSSVICSKYWHALLNE